MWEILQEKVYKTRITDLELSTTALTNGCRNDDMIQPATLYSQSLFQFVQSTDAYFVYFLLQYLPHAVINWIQIWQIWGGGTVEVEFILEFLSCNNSMVARVR